MKCKMFSIIAGVMFAFNVNAYTTLDFVNKTPDKLSNSLLTVMKDDNSAIDKNKKVDFSIKLYVEKIKNEKSLDIKTTGVYDKSSPLVSDFSGEQYSLNGQGKQFSYQGVTAASSIYKEIKIIRKFEVNASKDGSIVTTQTPEYLKEGTGWAIKKVGNVVDISLSQTYIDKMRKYKSEFGVLDLPDIYSWETNQKLNVQNNQVIRIDSPIYKIESKSFRNIYLIEAINK